MNTHRVVIGIRPAVLGALLMAQASSSAFDANWAGGSGNWLGINWTPQPLDFTLELGLPVPWPTWPDNVRSSSFGLGFDYSVRISGGEVSLDSPVTISGLDVGGSGELEINTGGILTLSELVVGSGGVVENDGRIRLDGDGILTGAGLQLQGFGRTEFADENAQIATAVLAITAGHTVQGRGQVNAAAVENDGLILGNWPGSTLKFVGASLDNRDRIIGTNSGKVTIEVDSLDNDQLIAADGGDVKLAEGVFENDGLLRASAGGRLEISDATLNNNGHTIEAHPSSFVDFRNDATLEGGLLRSFGDGVFRLTDGPVTFTGGIVNQGFVSGVAASLNFLNAQLDNTAGVLEINAPAAAGAATPFTLIGGRLQGNGSAGFNAPLTLAGGPGGLTLGGPTVLVNGAPLHLGGVVSNHALVILTNAVLVAQSNAVLHGSGQFLIQPPPAGQPQNASKLVAGASTVFSNGPGHTILGTFIVSTGSLDVVNFGTLAGTETNSGLFTHFDLRGRSVTNLGLIEARPAVQLTLDTGTYWNEGGTIRSGSNATVTLANNPVVRGGRLDGTGTFQNTGFTVLDGQGTPVTLADARFLTGSDRTTYLQGTLTLENGAVDIQDITGGVGSPNAQLAASGAVRIDGTGTLRFLQPLNVNGLAGNRLVGADAASTLTLEPGVLFDTPTNGSGIVTVRLNNEGTVRSAGSVDFWSRSNVNSGTLTAASGGRLALTGDTADGIALENTGGTLHAEAGGQMLYGALARPIHLRGGRLTGPGTHLGSYSVTLDGTGEALRIENATLRLGPTTAAYLAGRLTLNGGTLLLDDTAGACCGNDTWLHVQPGAVIDGSGTLLFGFDNPALASDAENNLAGSALSVGAGVSLLTTNQGNGFIACGLINAGLVHAAAGKLLLTGTNHLNNGEYRASGGGTMTLALGNQTTVISNHQGRFTTDSTGRIVFGDTYYFSSGTRILGGELFGPGLFDLAGSVELNGAAIPVLFGQGTMRLAQNTALYLVGGLAMDGSTIQLRNPGYGAGPSLLVASGPVGITGPGLIEFSTPHDNRLQGGHFDLGPQVVLRATNNAVGSVEADFTLRGLAEARSGSSLNVLSLNVTNAGQIAIRSGARADFGKATVTQKIWNEGGSISVASNGAVYFNHFIDLVGGTLEGDGQFSMNNWMLWRGTGEAAALRDARLLIYGGSVNYYQEGRLRLERGTLRVGNPGGYGTTGTYLNSSGGTAVVEGNGRMEFFYQYPSGGSFLTGSWQFAPGITLEFNAYESVNISARVLNEGTMSVLRGFHLSAGAALTNAPKGRLVGTGTISVSGGALQNQGILAPGAPHGALTISGPVNQSPSSRLEIELAGTATSAYDRLNVSAGFPLPATLAVSLMNGFQPALNGQFVIVQGGSFTGAFQSQLLPTPGPGLRFTNEQSASQIILRVIQSTNPAVAYTNWAAPLPPGLQDAEDDGDGDGLVNAVEFALGTDPQIPTTERPMGEIVASAGERFPALVFNRSKTATGVRLLLDSADNLESPQWRPVAFALELVADVDATRERIRLRDLRPLSDGARRFLRLEIELTP